MSNETKYCIVMAFCISIILSYMLGLSDGKSDCIVFSPKFTNPPLMEKAVDNTTKP